MYCWGNALRDFHLRFLLFRASSLTKLPVTRSLRRLHSRSGLDLVSAADGTSRAQDITQDPLESHYRGQVSSLVSSYILEFAATNHCCYVGRYEKICASEKNKSNRLNRCSVTTLKGNWIYRGVVACEKNNGLGRNCDVTRQSVQQLWRTSPIEHPPQTRILRPPSSKRVPRVGSGTKIQDAAHHFRHA